MIPVNYCQRLREVLGMIKLNILNLKAFLETVNACKGEICMICPNGKRVNIKGETELQRKLWEQYRSNKNCLPLVLETPQTQDYMSIISYYAGDC